MRAIVISTGQTSPEPPLPTTATMETTYTDILTLILDELADEAGQRTTYAQQLCSDTAVHIFGTLAELSGRLAFAIYTITLLAGITLICTNLGAVKESYDLFVTGQEFTVTHALTAANASAYLLPASPTLINIYQAVSPEALTTQFDAFVRRLITLEASQLNLLTVSDYLIPMCRQRQLPYSRRRKHQLVLALAATPVTV